MTDSETPWGTEAFRLIDQHVGLRLKERRQALGVSKSRFADDLHVSTVTLVKYEAGELSIPASNLYNAANFLGVPIDHFYEGLDKRLGAVECGNVTPFRRATR